MFQPIVGFLCVASTIFLSTRRRCEHATELRMLPLATTHKDIYDSIGGAVNTVETSSDHQGKQFLQQQKGTSKKLIESSVIFTLALGTWT